MGYAARKRECVTRDEVINEIAHKEGECPREERDLLVLAGVDMQRQRRVEWFLRLPRAQAPVALGGPDADNDRVPANHTSVESDTGRSIGRL